MNRDVTNLILMQRDGLLEAKRNIEAILDSLNAALRRTVAQHPEACPYCAGTGTMTVDERIDDGCGDPDCNCAMPVWVTTDHRCALGCESPTTARQRALACDNIPF